VLGLVLVELEDRIGRLLHMKTGGGEVRREFETNLGVAGEHVQEVLRLHMEDGFVRVAFADTVIVDLFDLDIGKGGVVEQSA
jgi:hypothetical protein